MNHTSIQDSNHSLSAHLLIVFRFCNERTSHLFFFSFMDLAIIDTCWRSFFQCKWDRSHVGYRPRMKISFHSFFVFRSQEPLDFAPSMFSNNYWLYRNDRLLSLDIYDCGNYLCAVKCLKTNDFLFSSIDSMTWLLKNSICLKLMELNLFKWRRYFNVIIFETFFGKRLKLW